MFIEESSITYLLLTGAEAIEAQDWQLALTVVDSGENSFQKLAFFFIEGLQYKSFNAPEFLQIPIHQKQTDTMSAFQMLQELTPYLKFAHLAANQAIHETRQGDSEVHVIDFDIMEGTQWPPLMIDLVLREGASLRILLLLVTQQAWATFGKLVDGRKSYSIYLPFRFEQILLGNEEDYKGIHASNKLIANCMIHQLHVPYRDFASLSPKMIILTEELLIFSKVPSMSFVEFFREAFHHYTALYDSLVCSFSKGYKVGLKLIEEVLELQILDSLKQFPCESIDKKSWEDGFSWLKNYPSELL